MIYYKKWRNTKPNITVKNLASISKCSNQKKQMKTQEDLKKRLEKKKTLNWRTRKKKRRGNNK